MIPPSIALVVIVIASVVVVVELVYMGVVFRQSRRIADEVEQMVEDKSLLGSAWSRRRKA